MKVLSRAIALALLLLIIEPVAVLASSECPSVATPKWNMTCPLGYQVSKIYIVNDTSTKPGFTDFAEPGDGYGVGFDTFEFTEGKWLTQLHMYGIWGLDCGYVEEPGCVKSCRTIDGADWCQKAYNATNEYKPGEFIVYVNAYIRTDYPTFGASNTLRTCCRSRAKKFATTCDQPGGGYDLIGGFFYAYPGYWNGPSDVTYQIESDYDVNKHFKDQVLIRDNVVVRELEDQSLKHSWTGISFRIKSCEWAVDLGDTYCDPCLATDGGPCKNGGACMSPTTFPWTNIVCDCSTSGTHTGPTCEVLIAKSDCGELVVANGVTVPAGTPHFQTVDISCDLGYLPEPAQATCNDGTFTAFDCVKHCIVLIDGYYSATPVEYYHPMDGIECDPDITGSMSTDYITRDYTVSWYSSGCYLPATQQIVLRESSDKTHPALYGLTDTSAQQLPLTYTGSSPFSIKGSSSASVGLSKCISCGGLNMRPPPFISECYQFDPSVDATKWTPIPSMLFKGAFAAAVSPTPNDFYLIGGATTKTLTSKSMMHYNLEKDCWSTELPMSVGRRKHAAASLSNTEIIVCGGNKKGADALSSCEIYDTTQKKWRTTGSLNKARYGFAMVSFAGDIYALGGVWGGDTVEKYDRVTETWAMAKPMNERHMGFVAVVV